MQAHGSKDPPWTRSPLTFSSGRALALAAAGAAGRFADLEELAAAARPPRRSVVGRGAALSSATIRELVQLGGLYLASHPAPVRAAIDRHRRGLDANPVGYLHEHGAELEAAVLRAAAAYLGARPGADIALTDSTTMGLGLLYNGLELQAGDEVVTTTHDFYATHEALRAEGRAERRRGAPGPALRPSRARRPRTRSSRR